MSTIYQHFPPPSMKFLLLIHVLFMSATALGQTGSYSKYDWEKSPGVYTPDTMDLKEDAVILFENHHYKFIYDKGEITRTELLHIRKYLNTDTGIENNNRFYVNTEGSKKIHQLKARVIQPSGKIIELDQKNIIESKDENEKIRYRYFALEGIEKGSIVEYLHRISYKTQTRISDYFFCGILDVDGPSIKKNVQLTLTCNEALQLETQSINNAPVMSGDTKMFSTIIYNVDKSALEKYGYEADSKKQIYFTVSQAPQLMYYDTYFSAPSYYNRLSRYVYDVLYFEMARENYYNIKELNDFVKPVIDPNSSDSDKIKAIEYAIKQTFIYDEEATLGLREILTTKRINKSGSLKLMAYAAKSIGIESQFVFSCNRELHLFPDNDQFQSDLFIQDILLYFPGLDIYYQGDRQTCTGPAPLRYMGNNALFVDPFSAKANAHSAKIYSIKNVKVPPASYSRDVRFINVVLDTTTLTSAVNFDRSISGYFTEPYNEIFSSSGNPEQKELEESFFSGPASHGGEILQYTFENDSTAPRKVESLVGHVVIRSPYLITESDDKLLINLGSLIGDQPDLHNENISSRKFPVHIPHPCEYHHSIEFDIPKGYSVVNLSDFNSNINYELLKIGLSSGNETFHQEKRKLSFGFTSKATIAGNKIVITVFEWYEPITYSKEEYGNFIHVMNAAADFYSRVLVLEKK